MLAVDRRSFPPLSLSQSLPLLISPRCKSNLKWSMTVPKTYRVGVACMSHDHVWGELAIWQKQPNVELVAAGDDEPHLLERFTKQTGVTKHYLSWQEMIEREPLDIVQAAGGNSEGADIVEAAASRGI